MVEREDVMEFLVQLLSSLFQCIIYLGIAVIGVLCGKKFRDYKTSKSESNAIEVEE